MFQVYVIVNKINGKMYVGCTKRPLDVRLARHFIKAKEGSDCSLHKAIRKYNEDNFDIKMIEIYPDEKSMLQGEINWIAYFDTYKSPYGYNDTPGGEGGNTNGGKTFDEEWRLNISKAQTGKENLKTRRFSQEQEAEICRLYVEDEMSTYWLGKNFDVNRSLIISILDRNSIKRRKSNYTGHTNGRNIFTIEQEIEIVKEYLEGKISIAKLSNKFNCGKTTMRNILLRNNVEL